MATENERVRVGQWRMSPQGPRLMVERQRGRPGEARTMYVVGWLLPDGRVSRRETRSRATVADWPPTSQTATYPEGT